MHLKSTFSRICTFLQLAIIACGLTLTARAAGELDPTFNGSVFLQPLGNVQETILQPDGKILVAGVFEIVNGGLRTNIARLNSDGTIDTSFIPPEFSGLGNTIYAIGLQSNGKILVAGSFNRINGAQFRAPIARLNTDGSLDTAFMLPITGIMDFANPILDLAVLPDDKIVIGGNFFYRAASGNVREKIARLNPDGVTDETFSPVANYLAVNDITVQPDGKILGAVLQSGNNFFLKRLNTDGTEDTTFNTLINNTLLNAVELQADGKIIIGGNFTSVNNFPRGQIARLNTDGSLDQTFSASSDGNPVADLEIVADGKIIVGGRFNTFNSSPKSRVARLNGDGTIDDSLTFTNPTAPTETRLTELNDVTALPDGRVIVSGIGQRITSQNGGFIFRLNQNGAVDQNFSVQIGTRGSVGDIAVQADGKVLAAGVFSAAGNATRVALTRFNVDGSLDTTFDAGFFGSQADPIVFSVAVQPDGKILVGGRFGLVRRNSDGSADTSFSSGIGSSFIYDIVVLPDGKIIAVGSFTIGSSSEIKYIARFNPDGSLDATFQPPLSSGSGAVPRKVVVQSDGKLLIAGTFSTIGAFQRGNVARLNADGSLDQTFNPLGGANNAISDLDLQTDGKIIIVGSFTNVNGTNKNYIARLNQDGSLDQTFNSTADFNVAAVKIQTNGRIIIGGNFGFVNGTSRNGVARLNADGTLDQTFNVGGGTNGTVYALAIQPDSKILIGGIFTRYNNTPRLGIARLLNNTAARTAFDFDGDGRADIATFRPSNGYWYELRSQTSQFYAQQFGQSGDLIVPADYDGDRKTDIAVFRSGAFAYFYIFQSSSNTFRFEQFGQSGDVPLPGDWDGDGKADVAVYRGSDVQSTPSYFFYRPSTQPSVSYNTISIGGFGARAVYGDFDGDGRLDAAEFYQASGQWIVKRSSDNQVMPTVAFGQSGDIAVPADYDGDGITNIAVFRPSTGYWYTSTNPANNYGAIPFGQPGDLPVPADYDGDGKVDIAVFRPSNGAWYLLRSTQGFTGVAFGAAEDKPIPNAFIR